MKPKAAPPWNCIGCKKPLKDTDPFPVPVGNGTLITVACAECGPKTSVEDHLGAIDKLLQSWPAEEVRPKKKKSRADRSAKEEAPPSRYEVARQAIEHWKAHAKPRESPFDAWSRREEDVRKEEVEKRRKKSGAAGEGRP